MCEFTWIQLRVSLDLATRSVRLAITSPALTILPVLSALEGVGVRAVEEDAYLELGNLRVPQVSFCEIWAPCQGFAR